MPSVLRLMASLSLAPIADAVSRFTHARRKVERGVDIAAWSTLAVAVLGLVIAHKRQTKGDAKALADDGKPSRSASAAALADGRGRLADKPRAIPLRGWKDILKRTWIEFKEDNLLLVAAGVTFYTLLALFPAIAAFSSLYGIFADVTDAQRQIQMLALILPPDIIRFLSEQMITAAAANPAGMSLTFILGLLLAIWSANGAMKSMMLGLNIAYEEEEKRSFLRKTATSLAFTLGALLFMAVLIILGLAVRWAAAYTNAHVAYVLSLLRWPVLVAAIMVGVAALYRYGPSRDAVKWRWITWGSAGVTLVWIAASVGFSLYLARFGHYDRSYGQLSAVIAFLMWTYLSTVILLIGAELNAETEHQTAIDTTTGPPQPMGARRAAMADSVGAAQR